MKQLFTFLIFILSTCVIQTADNCIPQKPSPPRLVNNFSKEFPNFLSPSEQIQLENKLVAFNNSTSNQIVVVIVDDLCGYDANEFSTRLGQQWGVGQNKFDNGVVVMIKPTGDAGGRDAYIAVGYGLEGVIPDITAKEIVDNELISNLKQGDNYKALDAATTVLISLARKEYSSADYAKKHRMSQFPWLPVLFLIIIFFAIFRRRKRWNVGSRGSYYGGGWFGGGWGSGSSWGGGSGGFGGFGGGGFGGGGAGGKW